jgi:hypothetical protein
MSPATPPSRSRRATHRRTTRSSPRSSPRHRWRRRLVLWLFIAVVAVVAVALWSARSPQGTVLDAGHGTTIVVPDDPTLTPLRARIVRIAEQQVGYTTDPSTTYCNKFSAYWFSGTKDCGNSNLDEQWCADFAAWTWRQAGAMVDYQYVSGDLNSSSASFYEWGIDRGTWHAASSNYTPVPGDVAIYGLDTSSLVATHVAVVVGYVPGSRGPIAVNGDGDVTGFSVVEARADEYQADVPGADGALSGYVSPS